VSRDRAISFMTRAAMSCMQMMRTTYSRFRGRGLRRSYMGAACERAVGDIRIRDAALASSA